MTRCYLVCQLTKATVNGDYNVTDLYTYDAVGNRLSDWFGQTYTYNDSNQMLSYPAYSWTYDNNGNTTSETVSGVGTTSYSWDYENRLVSVALPNGGGTVSFKYDPFGRRIEKISPTSGTTIYAYDGDNVVEQMDGSGTATARYTQGLGIDEPLEMTVGRATYYYHADGLGSITELTKSNGSAVNTYTYATFGGDSPANSETVANPFHFTAREYDPETKLYYYRARYYDPLFGRFLSEDPEGYAGGGNAYVYAGNLPTLLTDPLGLFPTSWHRSNTYRIASRVFGGKCLDKAKAVADANASVDARPTLGDKILFLLGQGKGWAYGGPHFPAGDFAHLLVENAINSCSLHDVGTALHTLQDGYAHFGGPLGPALHYVTGPTMDITAAHNPRLAEGALWETEFYLWQFKDKCLHCCE